MYFTKAELLDMGFSHVGDDVRVSNLCRFYNAAGSSIGSETRIDDYSTFKGKVTIGSHIHIASFCLLSAVGGGITIGDYSGVASHCAFWTSIEDFVAPTLTSPNMGAEFSKSKSASILIGDSVKFGCNCIVLQGTEIGYGSSIAATTVVQGKISEGSIVAPKHRHFKIYGKRDVAEIRRIEKRFTSLKKG